MRLNFFYKISVFSKKIFSKLVFKILLCFFIIIFLFFSPSFIFNKNNFNIDINREFKIINNQKTVLNLWHIETFEGGSNNRGKFLEKCAIKYNKQNPNCLIYVKTLNEEQLCLNLKENKRADIYSFGIGSGYLLSGELKSLNKPNNIRENLLVYSMLGDNILAYPYMLSGYCLISKNRNSDSIGVLLKQQKLNNKIISGVSVDGDSNINPSAVIEHQINGLENNKDIIYTKSTYDAYCNFINGKCVSLLGTTRDLIRCKNREENGTLENCSYKYFSEYSDLIQYIGISSNLNEIKNNYASKFALFLTECECQNEIKNFGLFSCSNNKIYSTSFLSEFEDVLINLSKSINVFSNKIVIEELKEKAKSSIFS